MVARAEMPKFISPNEMLAEAKLQMLGGKEPISREDWYKVMNFVAVNVHESCAVECCKLIGVLYDIPMTGDEIQSVVEFQLSKKGR